MGRKRASRIEALAAEIAALPESDRRELLARIGGPGNGARRLLPRRSIMELEGLGEHLWRAMDVDAYIDKERNSWGS